MCHFPGLRAYSWACSQVLSLLSTHFTSSQSVTQALYPGNSSSPTKWGFASLAHAAKVLFLELLWPPGGRPVLKPSEPKTMSVCSHQKSSVPHVGRACPTMTSRKRTQGQDGERSGDREREGQSLRIQFLTFGTEVQLCLQPRYMS